MKNSSGKKLSLRAADLITEKKGGDIVILDLRKFNAPADYYLIASASSGPHLKALCDHLDDSLAKQGLPVLHVDGYGNSGWIVMDYFDVLIHLFLKERRAYYDLEDLYADAPRMMIGGTISVRPSRREKPLRRRTGAKNRR